MKQSILRLSGYILAISGIVVIITLRIKGVDLTEGQLFITYLPWWVASFGLCCAGALLAIKADNI